MLGKLKCVVCSTYQPKCDITLERAPLPYVGKYVTVVICKNCNK